MSSNLAALVHVKLKLKTLLEEVELLIQEQAASEIIQVEEPEISETFSYEETLAEIDNNWKNIEFGEDTKAKAAQRRSEIRKQRLSGSLIDADEAILIEGKNITTDLTDLRRKTTWVNL